MSTQFLDFEQPIVEFYTKIEALRATDIGAGLDIEAEIHRLEKKKEALTISIFKQLTPWQIVQLARHPLRPRYQDYLPYIFEDIDFLAGDRYYKDDKSIVGGLAYLAGQVVVTLGHQKGRTAQERVFHNFGMPKPEGYRKALRLIRLAEQFGLPIISFIDTPGAYPGVDAEARNQSEAIATNLQVLSLVKTPIITVVIGEGGSGGALAIGVGDRSLMLQYSIYAVISPEGCASILWRNAAKASEAAAVMHLTADKLLALKLIDEIISEPLGGAHCNPSMMASTLKQRLIHSLKELRMIPPQGLVEQRYQRLMKIGVSV